MGKGKKKGSKKPKVTSIAKHLNQIDALNGASSRVNSVIAKMVQPPETVLDHMKRIGVDPVIDLMSLDGQPPKPYILIDYDELVRKELRNISEGGTFAEEYPAGNAKRPMGQGLAELLSSSAGEIVKPKPVANIGDPSRSPGDLIKGIQQIGEVAKKIQTATTKFQEVQQRAKAQQPQQLTIDEIGENDDDYPVGEVSG